MNNIEIQREKAAAACSRIRHAYAQAKIELEEILEACGGFVKTLPCGDRPNVLAKVYDYSENMKSELVFGVRLIEGEGIFICNESSVSNYEFDNDYLFGYLYNFEEGTEDKENIEKLVGDPSYYISIEEDYIDTDELVYEILSAIGDYI